MSGMRLVEPDTCAGSEAARLLLAIDREAAETGLVLTQQPSRSANGCPPQLRTERDELGRQLAALRERAADAETRNQDPRAVRSELATLLSFAKTLRGDAEAWRTVRDATVAELERQRAEARQRRETWLAEHQELVRRRDALQRSIDEAATGLAGRNRGECRRTVPVLRLGEALTVCSVTVLSPRRWFRSWKLWLVTLNESGDEVLVRRC